MNEAKNYKLEVCIYINKDKGETWEEVNASGLDGDILAFSMHPTNSYYIAAATSSGAYLSSDGGATFKSITAAREIGTAVFFNEENLYYTSYDTHPKLVKYNIESGKKESFNLT